MRKLPSKQALHEIDACRDLVSVHLASRHRGHRHTGSRRPCIVDSHELVRNQLLMASCEALLRSGMACRSAALTDAAFCSHHATLVQEIGEERVRSGDHRDDEASSE